MSADGSFRRTLVGAAGVVLAASSGFASMFVVSNTNDAGPGSLRQAILEANAAPGADRIVFKIPGSGVHTISPLSPPPPLTDDAGVTIDGYTQHGSKPNTLAVGDNAVLTIEISGVPGDEVTTGIAMHSSSNLIRGLVIDQFGTAVWVQKGTGNTVSGCFLGTDTSGGSSRPNRIGIEVFPFNAEPVSDPTDTVIGGNDPGERNIVSGNSGAGVGIGFTTGSVQILGNYIGTDASGTTALPNSGWRGVRRVHRCHHWRHDSRVRKRGRLRRTTRSEARLRAWGTRSPSIDRREWQSGSTVLIPRAATVSPATRSTTTADSESILRVTV